MNKLFSTCKALLLLIISGGLINKASGQTISDNELMKNTNKVTDAISYISQLQPVQYEYKTEDNRHLALPGGKYYGLVAEDVQRVLPEMVLTSHKMFPAGKNNFKTATVKTIDYERFVPLLIASVQQQQQEIEQLKSEVRSLKQLQQ